MGIEVKYLGTRLKRKERKPHVHGDSLVELPTGSLVPAYEQEQA